ncbi:MAG: bifunctional riboflavin kinase/FAD synthetase [Anaerolineales bacterium]|nr:bifunctional riboflavin kinase/FAD synthetase [Anaerolineales bacterium]
MQHLQDLSEVRLERASLTIGSFDGVHLGHQYLLKKMVRRAKRSDLPVVVLTFYPHPSVVLRQRTPPFYITAPDEKAELLGKEGAHYVITQTFDLEFSRVEADDFLDRLTAQLGFTDLWAGEDFALGHQRRGNRHYLERESQARNFRYHLVPPVVAGGEVVSSTRVREALRSGDVARAATYLGRSFQLPGVVQKGAGRGKKLGIPTANLKIWEEHAYPAVGVYACVAEVDGERRQAVTNIGYRPTFEDEHHSPVVEAHILDFEGELYGKEIKLEFVDRLRDEMRFSGPEKLLEQIEKDIRRARSLLEQQSLG